MSSLDPISSRSRAASSQPSTGTAGQNQSLEAASKQPASADATKRENRSPATPSVRRDSYALSKSQAPADETREAPMNKGGFLAGLPKKLAELPVELSSLAQKLASLSSGGGQAAGNTNGTGASGFGAGAGGELLAQRAEATGQMAGVEGQVQQAPHLGVEIVPHDGSSLGLGEGFGITMNPGDSLQLQYLDAPPPEGIAMTIQDKDGNVREELLLRKADATGNLYTLQHFDGEDAYPVMNLKTDGNWPYVGFEGQDKKFDGPIDFGNLPPSLREFFAAAEAQ